jgi:hypothetical protein
MSLNNTEEQPPLPSFPPAPKESKQMCMVCGSYVAKTFIDLSFTENQQPTRIHLCYQDAMILLRMACQFEPGAIVRTHKFVMEQIYEKEV